VLFTLAVPAAIVNAVVWGMGLLAWLREGFHTDRIAPGKSLAGRSPGHDLDGSPPAKIATAQAEGISEAEEAAQRAALTEVRPERVAGFATRVGARIVDFSIVVVLSAGVSASGWKAMLGGNSLIGLLFLALCGAAVLSAIFLLYESLFVATCSATPGKALFGLHLGTINGQPLAGSQALQRAFDLLWAGMYFMLFFPYLQLFSAWCAFRCVSRGTELYWERLGRSRVFQRPIKNGRRMLAFGAAAIAATLIFVVRFIGKW